MKTIEIQIGNQIAQFTTKSVTFDGKEFFYSKMSNVTHNSTKNAYIFTYDNETKILPYAEKDAKILNAIFSQVQKLTSSAEEKSNDTSAAQSPTAQNTDTENADAEESSAVNVREQIAHEDTEQTYEPDETIAAGEIKETESAKDQEKTSDLPSEPVVFTDSKAAKRAEKERKKAEKEKRKLEKESADKSHDPDKKAKVKKSLLVFVIIIVVMAVLGAIYFIIFGPSKADSSGPSSTESQQYDDIDEIINDLQ